MFCVVVFCLKDLSATGDVVKRTETETVNAFFQELLHSGLYKRSQGRITRQVTFAAIAITLSFGLWRLSMTLKMAQWAGDVNKLGFHYWLPGALLVCGLWIGYRVVNVPGFADFLIAVEAEMNKVSWPARSELFRASLVVLITIFALAIMLTSFDVFWRWLFTDLFGIFSKKPV